MKLFVDTGNLKEIEALAAIGILDGVTTNPSLMAKETGDYRKILKQICQVVKGPVSAEVVATDTAGMMREGRDLAGIDEHIVVKVPFTKDGVKACKTLASEGHARERHADLLADAGLARGQGRRDLRQPVRRTSRRHRHDRDESDSRDRRHLRQLRVLDRGARGQRPPSDSYRRGGTDGRRRGDGAGGSHRAVLQASAHRYRPREVPEGLGEGAGRKRSNVRNESTSVASQPNCSAAPRWAAEKSVCSASATRAS